MAPLADVMVHDLDSGESSRPEGECGDFGQSGCAWAGSRASPEYIDLPARTVVVAGRELLVDLERELEGQCEYPAVRKKRKTQWTRVSPTARSTKRRTIRSWSAEVHARD
jgi:hypothetical protein